MIHFSKGKAGMRKIYLATIVASVTAAIVGGIILTQLNGVTSSNAAATPSPNHQSKSSQSITTHESKGSDNGGGNFGPPDNGGFDSGDQLLG